MSAPTLYSVPMRHRRLQQITDWTDQHEVHRAVMSLYSRQLDGPTDMRRASAAILYRLEPTFSRVLLQSTTAPSAIGEDIRAAPLQPLVDQITPGRRIRIRVDVNAVRIQSQTKRRVPVARDAVPGWFRERVAAAFSLDDRIDVDTQLRRTGRVPLHTALISTQGAVNQRDAAIHLMTHGLGRARAYGCGLISIALVS